jgi:hypothetical protein
MSPNLSFEHLAIVLALAGCSKATPAADQTSTVRSDPAASASAPPLERQDNTAKPPSASITATAVAAPMTGGRGGGPGGAASATDLRKKDDMHMANPTGQASCGAGSCTSEIKKK